MAEMPGMKDRSGIPVGITAGWLLPCLIPAISLIAVLAPAFATDESLRSPPVEIIEEDVIVPIEIEHKVEELVFDGKIQQRYNYIDYHFEKHDAYIRARTYLYPIESVSVFGPFRARGKVELVAAPRLYDEVLAYLKRRFLVIERLSDEGYVTVWQHPSKGK